MKLSTRNQLRGEVTAVKLGGIMAEINVDIGGQTIVAAITRESAEHLELAEGDVGGPPSELIDRRWRPVAREQRERQAAGRPLTHRLVELQGVSRHTGRMLGPIDGLLVDG